MHFISVVVILVIIPLGTPTDDKEAMWKNRRSRLLHSQHRRDVPFLIRVGGMPHPPRITPPANFRSFSHSAGWRAPALSRQAPPPPIKSSPLDDENSQSSSVQEQQTADQPHQPLGDDSMAAAQPAQPEPEGGAVAAPPPQIEPEVSQFHSQDTNGQVLFGFNSPDQMRIETRNADGTVHGTYSYLDPYGQVIKRQYWDTGNGFHVTSNTYPINGVSSSGFQQNQPDVLYTPEVQAARDLHFQLYQQALASLLPRPGVSPPAPQPQQTQLAPTEDNSSKKQSISNRIDNIASSSPSPTVTVTTPTAAPPTVKNSPQFSSSSPPVPKISYVNAEPIKEPSSSATGTIINTPPIQSIPSTLGAANQIDVNTPAKVDNRLGNIANTPTTTSSSSNVTTQSSGDHSTPSASATTEKSEPLSDGDGHNGRLIAPTAVDDAEEGPGDAENGSIVIENPEYLRISWSTPNKEKEYSGRTNSHNVATVGDHHLNGSNKTSRMQIKHELPSNYRSHRLRL